jgi:hypothetical protein
LARVPRSSSSDNSNGGNINVALSLAQTARKGLPDLPNSADTLGLVNIAKVSTTRRSISFRKPSKETPISHLGMAYEKANNPIMARTELEYTLKISPNCSQADQIKKGPRRNDADKLSRVIRVVLAFVAFLIVPQPALGQVESQHSISDLIGGLELQPLVY